MNESGRAVQAAMQFYKLEPGDVTVIHDEIDLPLGKVKVKRGGGAGGHNGIRSIDAHIGPDYRRIRLGVGHPGIKSLREEFRADGFRQRRTQAGRGDRRSRLRRQLPISLRRTRTSS